MIRAGETLTLVVLKVVTRLRLQIEADLHRGGSVE